MKKIRVLLEEAHFTESYGRSPNLGEKRYRISFLIDEDNPLYGKDHNELLLKHFNWCVWHNFRPPDIRLGSSSKASRKYGNNKWSIRFFVTCSEEEAIQHIDKIKWELQKIWIINERKKNADKVIRGGSII